MTREIKFRVWEETEKVMHEVIEVSFRKDREGVLVPGDSLTGARHISLAYDNKLMQYTGLKDKNGKEIFEGDILATLIPKKVMFAVVFEEGAFVMSYKSLSNIGRVNVGDALSLTPCEIAGNIYENPDLLKED